MTNKTQRPPVIVIGMHRSGTSLLTRMLERLGLFIGNRRDENDEAFFFQKLNDWLLQQCGATWRHPEPIRSLVRDPDLRELAVDYLEHVLASPRVVNYLGFSTWVRSGNPFQLTTPWGWKDPRNTFTLPLWLDLFPDARVVHICRHGIDVARSLQVRDLKIANAARPHAGARWRHKLRKRLGLYWLHPKRGGFGPTVLYESLDDGLALWEAYLREAEHHTRNLGDQALEIKYEDFLTEPRQSLLALAEFCQLAVREADINRVTADLRLERAFAYREHDELREFSGRVHHRLSAFGY